MDFHSFSSQPILNALRTAIVISNQDGQILWVNIASEELFATSNKRLQKYNIQQLFKLAKPSLSSSSPVSPSVSSLLSGFSKHTSHSTINHLTSSLQPIITHDQWIVGTQEPILVDYCISPFDACFSESSLGLTGIEKKGVEHKNVANKDVENIEPTSNLYLIEIWAKNRHHQISQEQSQQAQYNLAKKMLRSVAHEVKNPLAGIRGAGQLLIKHLQKLHWQDNKTQTYTDIIISETDRLTSLINQLLGMKYVGIGQSTTQLTNQPNYQFSYQPSYEPLNIHKSLEQVLTLIQSESNASSGNYSDSNNQFSKPTSKPIDTQLSIIRDYDLSLPEVMGDGNQLIQVFLNLAKNATEAIESMKSKLSDQNIQNQQNTQINIQTAQTHYQPTLTIITRVEFSRTIGTTMHKKVAKISVLDNGIGIDDELKEQIFFPLVTGRADGTGLGLSVVHDIISQHQGQIEVVSNYGVTAFHVYLPFA